MLKNVFEVLEKYYFVLISSLALITNIIFILTKVTNFQFWLSLTDLIFILVPLIINYYQKIKFNELDINFLLFLAILISFFNSYYNLTILLLFFISIYPLNEKLLLAYLKNDFNDSRDNNPEQYIDVIKKRKTIKTLIGDVKVGDKIVLSERSYIPFDVILLSDQATIESIDPITSKHHKTNIFKNSEILAGSKTISEQIEVKVIAISSGILTRRITSLKRSAISSQNKTSRKIISSLITYHLAVLSLAILLFSYNKNLADLIKILVIASPYLLIISSKSIYIPIINSLYDSGVLVKSSRSIELLAKTKTIIFGKNGVLTSSNKNLETIYNFSDKSDDEILILASSMLQSDDNPTSQALLESSRRRKLKLVKIKHIEKSEFESSAKLKNDTVKIGLESIIKNQEIEIPKQYKKIRLASSALYLIINDKLSAVITFKEEIPKNNFSAIDFLKSKVKNLIVMSSDNESAIKAVSEKLNIASFFSNQTVKDKLKLIGNQKQKPITLVSSHLSEKSIYARANCIVELSREIEGSLEHHPDFIIPPSNLSPLIWSFRLSKLAQNSLKGLVILALVMNLILIYISIKLNFNLILSSVMQVVEINLFVLIIIAYSLAVEKKSI